MTNLAFQAKELMHRMTDCKVSEPLRIENSSYNVSRLGHNLKKYRERLGFTQMELATLIGYSNSHICHIEQGNYLTRDLKQSISLDLFLALCRELGCTAEDLLT